MRDPTHAAIATAAAVCLVYVAWLRHTENGRKYAEEHEDAMDARAFLKMGAIGAVCGYMASRHMSSGPGASAGARAPDAGAGVGEQIMSTEPFE